MHTVAGLLIAVSGAVMAVFGPAFAARVGSRAGQRLERGNTLAFRAIGAAMAAPGALYAVGAVG
ncbi:hypothetical protein [Streptomyces sp. NPDC048481]|uniref:hypothetical protein n=1 Tax=Streptomyces sp. NPDC048481 TaxID=3365557 RepID=UPI0037141AAB